MFYSIILKSISRLSEQLPLILSMTFVKGFFVFAVIFFIDRRIKKFSAGFRHLLWLFVICSFILIPAFQIISPSFDVGDMRLSVGKTDQTVADILYPLEEVEESIQTYGDIKVISRESMADASTAGSNPGAVSKEPASPISLVTLTDPFSWTYWVFLIWVAGICVSILKIIIGKIGLMNLTRKGRPVQDKRCFQLKMALEKDLGIKKDVMLIQSTMCMVPFTCNFFRPVIILPADFKCWTAEQMRIVLVHEMAHIRRRDCLTSYVSRTICAFFWFVPVVWIAYKNLLIEQEKACDSLVINAGTKPAEYAGHIVDLVRFSHGHVLMAGVYNGLAKKNILEKRIADIIAPKRETIIYCFKHIRKVIIVCFLCLLPLLFINPGIAGNDVYVTGDREEIYGVWVNPEYISTLSWGRERLDYKPDGNLVGYRMHDDSDIVFAYKFTFKITDKWTDSSNNVWYKYVEEGAGANCSFFYVLVRISDSGKTLEYNAYYSDYPDEINPNSYLGVYKIFYRGNEV